MSLAPAPSPSTRSREIGAMQPVRIGGTGAAMAVADIVAWVKAAEAGRELAYAEGSLPGWSKPAEAARDLDARRIVFAFFDGRSGHYVMRRLDTPYSPPPKPFRIARAVAGSADDKARLLKVLRAEARAGQPCSTNKVLAIKAGLSGGDRASYLLKLLVKDGEIANRASDWWPGREIEIVATGDRTFVKVGVKR
ncbi:hypothetical protein Swit_2206 [Rhizorhabdus wittichii RW1]|uniref:Uncharacterized protein n=1 Tax=Rhizorhabdus wittichii (strain DSM 6014 / CCUG 31198 / JCM 15750 / NBRC 105917 / EY 4224 / RW1) TaxID=392499 RepID=A0A9J9HBI5_RHIWR|nr:hypothetical protein Swit_2206 [Rhizorhabdus wittichii RW1]